MKLLLLTQYWPPEYGPDQAILVENMTYLSRHGIEVTVVAALPSYPTGIVPPAYRNRLVVREVISGIPTVRTWTYSGDRMRMKHRVLNEVSFAASCFLALPFIARRYDLALTLTPPQQLTPAGWLLSKLLRARYGLYVMDLMPEVAISLGIIENRRIIAALRVLARFCYERASVIVAASEEFKRGIEAYGIPARKIFYVPNGIDTELFRPGEVDQELRSRLGLEGKFLAIYAGTHGFSHDLDSILSAAERLQQHGDGSIAFVLVGDGSDKPRIVEEARSRRLRHVHFLDPVPRERLPSLLNAADVVLVTFRRKAVNTGVIPIKMYDAMACARPIILAIEGEARDMLCAAQGGITIEPESPDQLVEALLQMQHDPTGREVLGDNGRRYVEARFSREHCAERLRQAIAG